MPAAITALSGDSLNELHLQGNADLAQRVPSLSFDVLGPGESTLSIRGLGTAYGLAPAVSYYLNETPLDIRTDGYAGAPDIDFFDVDRVEVLRGPQGTLYGSSAMGGALRILTAQPNPAAFAVNAEVGGSNMERRRSRRISAKSAVNLPLSDRCRSSSRGHLRACSRLYQPRYSGRLQRRASQRRRSLQRRINDVDIKSARIIGTWKPIEALTITPSFAISRIEAADKLTTFSNLPAIHRCRLHGLANDQPTHRRQSCRHIRCRLCEHPVLDLGALAGGRCAAMISRCSGQTSRPSFGLTYPPNTPGTDFTTSRNSGFVQELRLTSPAEQRLRWVAGAYFSRFRQHSTETTGSADFAAAIGQTDSPVLYTFDQAVIDQQAAVFADLTYKILPQLEITAGERYYELRDSLENEQAGVLAAPSQPLVHAKASGNSPRVVLTYHPSRGCHTVCNRGTRLSARRTERGSADGYRLHAE